MFGCYSFLSWSDSRQQVPSFNNLRLFLSAAARISPFAQSKDGHLSSRRTASYFLPCALGSSTKFQHFYGKPQSFWLMKSKDVQNNPRDPQPRRTGGVLQCCHCSSKRKERVRRSPGGRKGGKNHDFQFKRGQKSSVSLQAVGKLRETLFHSQTKTILALLFPLDAFSYNGML